MGQIYDKSVYPYPKNLGDRTQWWWTASRMSTDAVPGLGPCGARWLARTLKKGGTSTVYTYLFAHPTQLTIPGVPGTGPGSVIVPHAAEIPYVFDEIPGKDDGADLASKMSKYWGNFASTGTPNDGKLPQWPQYTTDTDINLRFDVGTTGISAEQHLRKAACDYREEHYGMQPEHFAPPTAALTVIV